VTERPSATVETLKVAVVDDEPLFLYLLDDTLKEAGMDVTAFGAPTELLARYRPGAWDAIVTDDDMPALTGIELLGQLQLRGFGGPAILLTGGGDEALAVSALRGGFSDYIVKRTGTDVLEEIVRSVRGAATKARLERDKAQLHAEGDRLARAARSVGDALLMLDSVGKVTFASPAACEFLGTDGNPLVGRSLFDLVDLGQDADGSSAMLDSARVGCWRGIGTQGRQIPVLVTLSPIDGGRDRSGSGELVCLVVDASLWKERSEQREHALAAALVRRRLEGVGTLAARIAHEVNNPTTWLMLNLETLADEIRATVEEAGSLSPSSAIALEHWGGLVDACLVGVDRITSYTGRLLTMTREEARDVRPVRPVDCVRSALTLLGRDETQARIIDLLPDGATVAAEAAALAHAVAALLENAYDAVGVSSRGDGPDASSCVCVVLRAEGASIEIAVKDAGCGLPAGSEERLFEPFFTTKADHGGTGLGLTMASSIARRFGGSLRVSTLALGEAFKTAGVIALPASGAAAPAIVS
jgi:PAS domain S-box-containing protein